MKDAHDKRDFRRYLEVSEDGIVLAVRDVAAADTLPAGPNDPVYVDVTDQPPRDWQAINVFTNESISATIVARARAAIAARTHL